MKQRTFEKIHRSLWEQSEELVEGGGIADPLKLPSLHRRLCHSLSMARSRGYAPSLVHRLHHLANRSHARFYGTATEAPAVLRTWISSEFPRRVRSMWPYLLASLVAFLGPALVAGIAVHLNPSLSDSILGPGATEHMKSMFAPGSERIGRDGAENDLQMFGFYIWNNVSILFRTMATGVFLGVPSLLAIGFNGTHLGAAFSVMLDSPANRAPFFTFVATHSALELTAIVVGGASALRLGWAILRSGRRSRMDSFRHASAESLPVMGGASLMMAGAAFLEAFWSANATIDPSVRIGVGICLWALVLAYFALAGRFRAA